MMKNVDFDDAGTPALPILLMALIGAPVVWTMHLFISYTVVAVDCATPWSNGRVVVALVTALAILMTLGCGVLARRVWVRARAIDRPTDDSWDARMGERSARVSFLMVTGLVLSILFTIAIAYVGIPLLFLATCPAGVGN